MPVLAWKSVHPGASMRLPNGETGMTATTDPGSRGRRSATRPGASCQLPASTSIRYGVSPANLAAAAVAACVHAGITHNPPALPAPALPARAIRAAARPAVPLATNEIRSGVTARLSGSAAPNAPGTGTNIALTAAPPPAPTPPPPLLNLGLG